MTAIKRKQKRKDVVKSPDAFLSAASGTASWLTDHKRPVIIGTVVSVAIVLGLWGFLEYSKRVSYSSSKLLYQATKAEDGELLVDASSDAPIQKSDRMTFATVEDKNKAIKDAYQAVIKQYDGKDIAQVARFQLAAQLADDGQTDQAIQEYQSFLKRGGEQDNLAFLAHERLGYLYESRKDYDSALSEFEKLLGTDQTFYHDAGLYHQGRIYALKGDSAKAREMFDQVAETSEFKKQADLSKSMLAGKSPAAKTTGQP